MLKILPESDLFTLKFLPKCPYTNDGRKMILSFLRWSLSKGVNVKFLKGGWYSWIFQVCKICACSQKKNLPKGRNFTYLEDAGISMAIFCHFFLHSKQRHLFSDPPGTLHVTSPAISSRSCEPRCRRVC